METEIWIGAIYIFAASVAVKFFLPIDFAKARFRPKFILFLIAFILFPLWLPFTVLPKWRAWTERQSYIVAVDEYFAALEEVKAGREAIDAYVENLARFPDEMSPSGHAEKLAILLREHNLMRDQTLPKLYDQAQTIYSRNSAFFRLDETLPKIAHQSDRRDRLSPLAADTETPSRLQVSFKTDNGELSAKEQERIVESLRDHLVGRTVIRNKMEVRFKLKRLPPQDGVKTEAWTLEFSSSFKKSIKRVGRSIQDKTNNGIAELLINPMTPKGDTITRLSNDKSGMWRYRLGEYRLIYIPIPEQRQLVVLKLAHRKEAYH